MMSIDPYSLCPGGTGKKLKFCCSDLLHELGKIEHMLQAEQRQACVDYITQLEAKYPDRACLLTTKALVLNSLEQDEEAMRAADRLLKTQPTNPVALAVRALVLCESDEPTAALRPLHQALAACGTEVPQRLFEAVGVVAESLLSEGFAMAAMAHLIWQIRVMSDYEPALVLAYRIQAATGLPLLFKDIRLDFDSAPEAVPYKAEFDAALEHARMGHWLKAADQFDALMFRAAGCAALWRNLGRLRAYSANEAGAAEALRRYAALDVPLDDAVEAQMLAYLLDPKTSEAMTEQVRVTYQPTDLESAAAALSASALALNEPADGIAWEDSDEPPPRAIFSLLDRPMPPTGQDITESELPDVLGWVFLFGRQTDREPRLELLCERPYLERAKASVQAMLNQVLGPATAEGVAGHVPSHQFKYVSRWRAPPQTPPERIATLDIERQQRFVFERWPNEPNALFGGRTPRQAATDRTLLTAVLAVIALWELNSSDTLDFDELRRQLELPAAEPIDPTTAVVETLSVAYLHRLDVKRLSDDQLARAWRRAVAMRARRACRHLAGEVVARPSMSAADRSQAHGVLASLQPDITKGLEQLERARELAKSAGISCAGLDLQSLPMMIAAGTFDGFKKTVEHITAAHRGEPGVMEQLLRFLYEAGLIDEQGRPVEVTQAASPEILVPGGASAAAGKIWTPESASAAEKKSSLWVPGT